MHTTWIHAMGTTIKVSLEHKRYEALFEVIESKVRDWENRFSANDDASMLMHVNHQAGIAPVVVDEDLFKLIEYGKSISISSNQKMNITIGPLVKLWRIGFKDSRIPAEDEITRALQIINPHDIQLNDETYEVFLHHKGMEIDLGALAKGYFADEIKKFLIGNGVTSAIIDFGGNIVTIGGPYEDVRYFDIGIQHPFLPRGNSIATIKVHNQAVVTSGVYERKFEHLCKQYHHIIDSTTGYPVDSEIVSATIIADNSTIAEYWSTACFFYPDQHVITMINALSGIECIMITSEQEILTTDHINFRI